MVSYSHLRGNSRFWVMLKMLKNLKYWYYLLIPKNIKYSEHYDIKWYKKVDFEKNVNYLVYKEVK